MLERIDYHGWPNSIRLSNGLVELVLLTDVGPRVIRFGFPGGANAFKEYEQMRGQRGGQEWRIYGGHRLWCAPEDPVRTYCPDNAPVAVLELPHGVRAVQPTEPETGLQKEMDIWLDPQQAQAFVTHRLRNNGQRTLELATWAISVMAPGGTAVLPLPPRGTHPEQLLPTGRLILWAYTDMTDPRWTWGQRYVLLRQVPGAATPQKAGALVPDAWAAYARDGQLFVVHADYTEDVPYPDLGCNMELWTDAEMLELETLGPLVRLEPDHVVEHVERWFLFDRVPTPQSEADVEGHIWPRVSQALRTLP